MDEKTTRLTRAKIYVVFAVISVIVLFILTGTTRRILLAACAVYCLVMAWYNYRKAKDEDGK